MSSNRTGTATFWSQILSLVNGETPSKTTLYDLAIHKLQDNGVWLAAEIVRRFAKLASTSLGTKATLTGSVDLRGLVYDQVSGAVNGMDLQLQTDTSGVVTVTFPTGSTAPGAPGDIATAINGELGAGGSAYVNDSGLLVLQSATTGGSGTIEVLGGSALSVLGLTATTATGSATGGDGFSQVSGAAVTGSATGPIPAGPLRSVLQWLADRVPLLGLTNTWTKPQAWNYSAPASTSDQTVDVNIPIHFLSVAVGGTTFTLSGSGIDGQKVRLCRLPSDGDAIVEQPGGATEIITLTGLAIAPEHGGLGWCDLVWRTDLSAWALAGWYGGVPS